VDPSNLHIYKVAAGGYPTYVGRLTPQGVLCPRTLADLMALLHNKLQQADVRDDR
jgi:hypothetical protein